MSFSRPEDAARPALLQMAPRPAWLTRALDRAARFDLGKIWSQGIKLALSLLILTILTALTGGVVRTFLDLRLLFHNPVEVALRQVIIDTLILLAVVELFKTTLTYFSEGRVKVTFIIDTILVVMLTEVIAQWFKGGQMRQLAVLGVMLLVLGAMRVLAVRFSPMQGDGESDQRHEAHEKFT